LAEPNLIILPPQYIFQQHRVKRVVLDQTSTDERQEFTDDLLSISQFFPQDITAIENTLMRSRKILLFPSPEQKQIFKQWIGITRYLYNRAIDLLEKLYKEHRHYGKSYIRKQLVTNIPKGCEWMLQTPLGLREATIVDAVNAFSANLKKEKITGKSFTMKYRSKKDKSQSGVLVVDSLKPEKTSRNSNDLTLRTL